VFSALCARKAHDQYATSICTDKEVSKKEFDKYGGDFMVEKVMRRDCMHNMAQRRFMWQPIA
jgi:hypothetical protein